MTEPEEQRKTETETPPPVSGNVGFGEALAAIPGKMIEVIKNPVAFFRGMAKTGGILEPLIFMVVMAAVSAVIQLLFTIIGLGGLRGIGGAFAGLILFPVMTGIFGFLGALILFIIWKLMGSQENYEVSYRCGAYMMAISPITTILSLIPFLGALIGMLWGLFLIVTASIEVHKIIAKTAWIVFGAITALLFVFSTCATIASRKALKHAKQWEQQMEQSVPDNVRQMMKEMQQQSEQDS